MTRAAIVALSASIPSPVFALTWTAPPRGEWGRSLLLSTVTTFAPSGISFNMRLSSSQSSLVASETNSTTSALFAARYDRSTPIFSTSSSVSRIPAVSMRLIATPSFSILSSRLSRVVPAMSVTIALSLPQSALSKDDLPTLATPTIATSMPSRTIAPVRAVASNFSTCSSASATAPFASKTLSSSISSG